MNGLLLKDSYILKKFYLSILPMLLIYALVQFNAPESSMLSIMILLFGGMASQSTFSFDELAKCDYYILSSPISRRVVVKSKYVFSVLNLLLSMVIATGFNLIFQVGIAHHSIKEAMLTNLGLCAAALLYLSVTLPLYIKLGQEKARFFIIPIYMLPIAAVVLFSKTGILKYMPVLTEPVLERIFLFAPLVGILLLILSYYISVFIYEKKEF